MLHTEMITTVFTRPKKFNLFMKRGKTELTFFLKSFFDCYISYGIGSKSDEVGGTCTSIY